LAAYEAGMYWLQYEVRGTVVKSLAFVVGD
jgi:hypothetical protein